MAVVAYLLEKKVNIGGGKDGVHNRIQAMILAIDDAVDTTAALIKARGVTVANANGQNLPVGYFDTNRALAAVWDAAADFTLIDGHGVTETIA